MVEDEKKPDNRPRKKRVIKLSKKAKLEIIVEYMTDNPGAQLRRGFNTALIKHFKEKYDVKVIKQYMYLLVREAKGWLEKQQGYQQSKREYLLQYDGLIRRLEKIQDRLGKEAKVTEMVSLTNAERDLLRDKTKLEGHLKDIHVFEGGDKAIGVSIERFFDDKTGKEKGKKK